jgi:hypothetical protein
VLLHVEAHRRCDLRAGRLLRAGHRQDKPDLDGVLSERVVQGAAYEADGGQSRDDPFG